MLILLELQSFTISMLGINYTRLIRKISSALFFLQKCQRSCGIINVVINCKDAIYTRKDAFGIRNVSQRSIFLPFCGKICKVDAAVENLNPNSEATRVGRADRRETVLL